MRSQRWLVVRHLAGADDQPWLSGYGTAGWFAVMGSAVARRGLGTVDWPAVGPRDRGASRSCSLLPVAWYIAVGSHQWLYGIPIAIVALITLVAAVQPVGAAVVRRSGSGRRRS